MPVRDGFDAQALEAAAQALAAGELVALPTETVYGLGARADNDNAVERIFAAKGRPPDHPLIVHVAGLAEAQRFATGITGAALRLVQAFWPGPVTVIVPRAPGMATATAGGQDTIGLRCPSHPVARALLQRCAALGVAGVAAPSANRFGRISPTTAAHVADEFGPGLLILDGGPCEVGIESTIVDCSRGWPALLRPGVLTRSALEQALGEPLREGDEQAPRASGTLEAHYAPRAKLKLVDLSRLPPWTESGNTLALYSRTCPALPAGARWLPMPSDPAQAARALFATLRVLDTPEIQQIWVERPPDAPEWEGVRDRLRRAAAAG
jgi:L-threonylcarbamoyladenylate synthase